MTLRRLHAEESGMTIVEALLTCVIGVVVLGSATYITAGASRHNNEVASRSDATQRGRLATYKIQRILRSQACTAASAYPITSAKSTEVTVSTDTSDGSRPVERHTITYTPATKTLSDTLVKASGTPISFTGVATTAPLATNVIPSGNNAIFRYYAYPVTAPSTGILEPNVELIPPAGGSLSATDIGRISKIDINFLATGELASTQDIRAEMTESVFVRIADPNDAAGAYNPTCT